MSLVSVGHRQFHETCGHKRSILLGRAGWSHQVPLQIMPTAAFHLSLLVWHMIWVCNQPRHPLLNPPSASLGPDMSLALWWWWAPVSPVWQWYHQSGKQQNVRSEMSSNPFSLVSASACELQLVPFHLTSIFSSQLLVLFFRISYSSITCKDGSLAHLTSSHKYINPYKKLL